MAGSEIKQSGPRAVQAEWAGRRHCGNADRRGRGGIGKAGVAVTALLLAACEKPPVPNNDPLQDTQILVLQQRVEQLQKSIEYQEMYDRAEFSPGDKDYNSLSSGGVSVAVVLEGIEQSGSASVVRLKIGNLMAADLVNCSMFTTVRKTKDGAFDPVGFQKLSGSLAPGRWNLVTLTIPDRKTQDISAISLSAPTCKSILLTL